MPRTLLLLFAAIGFLFAVHTGPAHSGLLGEVYPGAVAATSDKDHDPVRRHVFYTKDGISQVYSFYQELYGKPEHKSRNQYSWVLKIHFAEYAGLTIETPRGAVRENFQASQSGPDMTAPPECYSHELFQPLNQIAMNQPERNKEFVDVCNSYLHLTWSYYMDSPEPDHEGRPRSMKEHILAAHKQKHPRMTEESMEDAYARMVAMAMAGQTEEVDRIGRQMIEGTAPSVEWDEYLSLLEELDSHAYQTRIVIQTDPSDWPEWKP